jgi:plastocyanin
MRWPRLLLAVVLAVAIPVLMAGPASAAKVVDVDHMAFTPHTVRITVGGAVKWKFNDDFSHNVTADDGSFHSPTMLSGTYRHVFRHTGTFRYHCSIHPEMTGKVVVRAARPHPAGIGTAARIVDR